MKKLFTLLFGIILGVVLVFGGVAFAGFYILTKEGGMSDFDGLIPGLSFSDEIKNMSVLDYVKNVKKVLDNAKTSTVGEIEDALGVSLSKMVADMLGSDQNIIRSATLDTLPTKILDSFTIETLETKFNFKLPNMPLFQSPEFRTKPLLEAFNSLSDKLDPAKMKVSDLEDNFGIKLSDNPLFSDPAIRDANVANLGEAIGKVQLSSVLGAVFQADIDQYNATHVLTEEELITWKLGKVSYQEYLNLEANRPAGDTTVYTFDYFDTEAEQTKYIEEYNKTPELAVKLIDKWSHLKEKEMSILRPVDPEIPPIDPEEPPVDPEIPPVDPTPSPAAPETVTPPEGFEFAKPVAPVVTEILAAPKLSSVLIRKLAVNKLDDMTSSGGSDKVINNIINNSTLGEIIGGESFNDPDSILYQLKDSKISTIDADIKAMPLKNLMKVTADTSAAMKYMVSEPMRTGWETNGVNTDGTPIYKLDANGKRIPIYQVKLDADNNPIYEVDADGQIIYMTNADGTFITDANGDKIPLPVYVYANIDTLDAKIKQMVIGDVLPETGEKNVVLEKVRYSTLDNLGAELNKAIDSTTIGELIKIDDTSSTVLQYLKDAEIANLNSKIDDMEIGHVIKSDASNHPVVQKMIESNVKVKDMGTSLGKIIEDTAFSDLITIDENSSSIFKALAKKGTTVKQLDSTLQSLTLVEMFGEKAIYKTDASGNFVTDASGNKIPNGVLGLIYAKSPDTNLSTIGTNASETITTSTLSELKNAGLLPVTAGSNAEKVLKLIPEATTLPEMPGAIVDIMLNTKISVLHLEGLITSSDPTQNEAIAKMNYSLQELILKIAGNATLQAAINQLFPSAP